jgi:hypothetical protein
MRVRVRGRVVEGEKGDFALHLVMDQNRIGHLGVPLAWIASRLARGAVGRGRSIGPRATLEESLKAPEGVGGGQPGEAAAEPWDASPDARLQCLVSKAFPPAHVVTLCGVVDHVPW